MKSLRNTLLGVAVFMKRHATFVRWAVLAATLLTLVGFAFLPMSWAESHSVARGEDGELLDVRQGVSTITVIRLPVRIVIGLSTAGLSLLVLWLAFRQLAMKRYLFAVLGLTLSVCGTPVSGLAHCGTNVLFWHTVDSVKAQDGNTYSYMASTILQGRRLCLARQDNPGLFTTKMRVLDCSGGDGLIMVRSARDAKKGSGQVLVCGNHVVVFLEGCEAYMAFDMKTKRRLSGRRLAHLSPFLCVGATSDLAQADVEALQTAVSGQQEDNFDTVYPDHDSLRLGINHPNPKVRKLARELTE